MIKADLLFISTGSNTDLLQQLITSIEGSTEGIRVFILIVNQGSAYQFKQADPLLEVRTLDIGRSLSLSEARNKALEYLFSEEVLASHVMFPDDDSTYKADFFKVYSNLSANKAYLAKICNAEDGNNYRKYPARQQCGRESMIPWVASVSLLIPYSIVKDLGYFDPKLGVGASWGSSEDLDYYLRASEIIEFCFLPDLKNYHPSRFGKYRKMESAQIRKRFKAYTDGYLAVYYRYNLESKLKLFASRALGGALVSFLKLDFNLGFQYLWLYRYRLQAKAYFRNLKVEHPQELKLEHGI